MDMANGHDVLCQDRHLVIEITQFTEHAKFRADVLPVGRKGGKETGLHGAVVTEDCVEVGEVKMKRDCMEWNTVFSWRVYGEAVDLKINLGDTQRMLFEKGDPPFYNRIAPKSLNG